MRKSRIGVDPNNTRWTTDTTTFGQRILRAQGWQPGEYLGATDAPHAQFHTAANASYIRVMLKEDAGGLGYKPGGSLEDDIAGLDAVRDIFGRLNGKEDSQAAKEREEREKKRAMMYLGQRGGGIVFVSGGLLKGDELSVLKDGVDIFPTKNETSESTNLSGTSKKSDPEESTADEPASRKRKRRRHETEDQDSEDPSEKAERKEKRKEKKPKRAKRAESSAPKSTSPQPNLSSSTPNTSTNPKNEKHKKEKKEKQPIPSDSDDNTSDNDTKPDKKSKSKREKKEKKERKEKKKEKKEEKRREKEKKKSKSKSKDPDTETPTSSASGTSTPTIPQGRHFARQQRISMKRAAVMDAAALKQIFMIKS